MYGCSFCQKCSLTIEHLCVMIFNRHLQYIIDTNQERYDLREKQMNGNEKKLHIRYFRVAAAIAVLAVLITSAVLIIRSRGKICRRQ